MDSGGGISALPTTSTAAIPTTAVHSSRHPIGEFFKRIRSRSKSPAPSKKSPQNQAWIGTDLKDSNVRAKNGVVRSPEHKKDTKSLPPRSPSGKKLKSWLSRDSPSQEDLNPNKVVSSNKGSFGHWVHTRFGRSPSGRKVQRFLESPAQSALRDQDKRGAMSEEDLVSKSLASEMTSSLLETRKETPPATEDNHVISSTPFSSLMMNSYHSQDSVFDTPPRIPSYMHLSCVLSGYGKYRISTPAPLRTLSPLSGGKVIGTLSSPTRSLGENTAHASTSRPTPLGKSLVERRLESFEHPWNTENEAKLSGKQQRSSPDKQAIQPVFAAEQVPSPVGEVAGNFSRLSFDDETDLTPIKKKIDFESEDTPTPLRDLLQNFQKLTLKDETPHSSKSDASNRPSAHPPPVPAIRKSRKAPTDDLTTINSISGSYSSADTETCMTGPLSTTQEDEVEGSLLDEVLKATEHMMGQEGRDTGVKEGRDSVVTENGIADDGIGDKSPSVGSKFLELTRQERARLEAIVLECEADLDKAPSEEVADYLRIAIGKCKLLLRKKFAKFEELIGNNLNPVPDDPRPTKDDDLEGYWPLVEMEIEDLDSLFQKIEISRQNQWDINSFTNEENGAKKAVASDKPMRSSGRNSPANQQRAAGVSTNGSEEKGRDEARQRIRAAKVAAKQRMQQQLANKNNGFFVS